MRLFFVALLCSWVGGIVLGVVSAPYYLVLLAAALISIVCRYWHLAAPISVAAIVLLGLGTLWGDIHHSILNADHACLPAGEFSGEIFSVLHREENRAQYLVAAPGDCTVLVVTSRWPEYDAGNIIKVAGKVEPISAIPAEYQGYAAYLKQRDISASVRYPSITVIDGQTGPMAWWRKIIGNRFNRMFIEPEASVISAMFLGDSGPIPDSINEDFRRTGITHILAISGENMSLIAAMILLVLLFFPVNRYVRTATLITLLWLYVWFLDWPVSATRAVVFWTTALVAWHLNGLISLPTIIITTLAAMISLNPLVMTDVGWQLSFAAVMGIGLAIFLYGRRAQMNWQTLLLSSLGATLATYPISVYHFGSLSMVSLLTNLLVLPVIPPLMILSVLVILTSLVSPIVSLLISYLVHLLWNWISHVTRWLAVIPGAYQEDLSVSWWAVLICYFVMIFAVMIVLKRQGRSWREIWQ